MTFFAEAGVLDLSQQMGLVYLLHKCKHSVLSIGV